LAEISLNQYGRVGGGWNGGGAGACGSTVSTLSSPHRTYSRPLAPIPPPPRSGCYEAEDAHALAARTGCYEAEDLLAARCGTGARGRAGLYYSPPGTSYTIVERPASATHMRPPPRATYLGSGSGGSPARSHHFGFHAPVSSGKKRPISPEQVLKTMFGSPGGGGGSSRRQGQSPPGGASSPPSPPQPPPPPPPQLCDLQVRTVTMVRGPPDPSHGGSHGVGHGFGICVKGGAKEGQLALAFLFYIQWTTKVMTCFLVFLMGAGVMTLVTHCTQAARYFYRTDNEYFERNRSR